MDAKENTKLSCPQCRKAIDTPVQAKIVSIRRVAGRKKVVSEVMDFCSDQCGDHYQMGHEG